MPNPQLKATVRDRIRGLLRTYPGNIALVTSRIVGYDAEARFDEPEFRHHKVARLRLPEIEQFVKDWYAEREPAQQEREAGTRQLMAAIRDKEHRAIRDLARNPLLLTIIALVHRIGAGLPDARAELYMRCTETLLNTWHTWKSPEAEDPGGRSKRERLNRQRMEAVAHWIQQRSVAEGQDQSAIVPHKDLLAFLAEHIRENERRADSSRDPEELAENFLDFIKQRAGLLVGIGERQFSFVHLTFQEYLTARHIYTISEKN